MRIPRLGFLVPSVFLAIAIASSPAEAAGNQAPGPLFGFGAGVTLPQGAFSEFNDLSYFVHSRSLYVEKVIGGRAAAYYADTGGKNGQGGGRVYGFDFDFLVKFGSAQNFGYVYAGVGYGTLTYSAPDPNSTTTPPAALRQSGWDWCWTAGIGVTIKKQVYLEASYVSYQTGPDTTDFIPVVIGFQF